MCEPGDIILIDKFVDDAGKTNTQHSFVVLSVEAGKIQGIDYKMVLSLMSSFRGKSEEYKTKKLSYWWNIYIDATNTDVPNGNKEEGFIKGNQLYYFTIGPEECNVIGSVTIEVWEKLNYIIKKLDKMDKKDNKNRLIQNINNL
ncbi:MAG TPA: hypothetical protein PLC53_01765 [Bacilli bacterium]|nr:hypothetical protein [Bacilli bacterium]